MEFIPQDELIQFIKTLKRITGLTYRDLEQRTGIANATISRIFSEKTQQQMDLATYERLMNYFSQMGKDVDATTDQSTQR